MQFFKNITLLNIILLAIVIFSLKFKVLPLLEYKPDDFEIDPKTFRDKDDSNSQSVDDEEESRISINPGDISSYSIISEQNLFHPDRKIVIVAEKKKEEPPPEETERPEFILFGTLIADDIRIAFMESNESKTQKTRRPRTSKAIKKAKEEEKTKKKKFNVGDTLEGYTLKEINIENVVLAKGDEKLIVKVYDPSTPKKRSSSSIRNKIQKRTLRTPPARTTTPQRNIEREERIKRQAAKREAVRDRVKRYNRRSRYNRVR